MDFPFPVITCDVGGTNVRSALFSGPEAEPRFLKPCKTADFPGLAEALQHVLADEPVRPASARSV